MRFLFLEGYADMRKAEKVPGIPKCKIQPSYAAAVQ